MSDVPKIFKLLLCLVGLTSLFEATVLGISKAYLSEHQLTHRRAFTEVSLFEQKFASIHVGDTRQAVRTILGKPDSIEAISRPITDSDDHGELWTYACPGRSPTDQQWCKGTVLLGAEGQVIRNNMIYPDTLESIR